MKWFKFDWFSKAKREELERLRNENQFLKTVNNNLEEELRVADKGYKSLYYSSGKVTVVLKNGEILEQYDVDFHTYEKIKYAATADEIRQILNPALVPPAKIQLDTPEEKQIVKENSSILKDNRHFEINNGKIYMRGVSLELPTIVSASFIEILEKLSLLQYGEEEKADLEEQFEALRMFWLKLALNGIEQSRNDLLNFVRKNDVRITRNGNLVLYRRVVALGDTKKYHVEFISQEYARIKGQKKSPKNYYVWGEDDGSYTLHKGVCRVKSDGIGSYQGTLDELYKDLPNVSSNEFTSWHNKGKHIIKIGSVYKIEEEGINLDNGICAAGGLHAACVTYNYSSFGDTPVVVLINPSKAITVPLGETGKLRTTEMFVACINDKKPGEHFEESALSAFDEEYNNISLTELENAVAAKSFEPATVVTEVSPITFVDLEQIKTLLKQRVKQI